MKSDEVIAPLRADEHELKEAGLLHLCLFGSVARGEASDESDVDLIGDFDRDRARTLFGMAGIEVRLADILGAKVDLADRKMLRQAVRGRAEHEAVLAF